MKKVVVFGAALAFSLTLHAQTIAQWTFETSVPVAAPGAGNWLTNIAPEVGSGSASGFHAGASIYTSPAGNVSAHSMSSTNWAVGDFYQFASSTAGFSDIAISYDQTSSGTGPGRFDLAYSLDGTTFTTITSGYTVLPNGTAPNPSWGSASGSVAYSYYYQLSSIPALNNAPAVWFRLIDSSTTSASGGTVGTGGTDRVDNFTIMVPEPQSLSLILAGLGLFGFRKLRRKN